MATDKPRFSITVSDDVYQQINDYQHEHRLPTQTKAVLAFIEKGLEVIQSGEKRPAATPEVGREFTRAEQEHIKKYRRLDHYGKEAVDSVLDVEHKRCIESTAKTVRIIRKPPSETAENFETKVNEFIKLRFSELKASAGTGYQLDEDQMSTWKVLYNEYTRMADFCLEVDGRSMEPKIYDGDIILIRQQPAVEIGEIGLFTVNDTGYVKKQGEDRLISINPDYDDIFPSEYDTVICRGKFIGVLEPEWIVEK